MSYSFNDNNNNRTLTLESSINIDIINKISYIRTKYKAGPRAFKIILYLGELETLLTLNNFKKDLTIYINSKFYNNKLLTLISSNYI